jgi:NADH-quinone oxidoreductase subunit N
MQEITFALPIVIVSLHSLIVIMVDALTGKEKSATFAYSIFGLLAVIAGAAYTLTIPAETLDSVAKSDMITRGMVNFGGYAAFFDIVFALAGVLTIFAARPYLRREFGEYKEFYSLIVFAVTGMIYIAHAENLLVLFIGIEIMSICFYILSGFIRNKMGPVESAIKYFLLGAFATGFLVYGMAMVYGATGSMDLGQISMFIRSGLANPTYLSIGLGLMIVGLSFKMAAFPFHQWAPDVYTGAPTVVTGFMSTAGKAAAVIAFVIVAKALIPSGAAEMIASQANMALENFADTAIQIIAIIAAFTMLIGNITAVVQKNVKRMLAYSSVAHAGYLLMGIVANNQDGWSGIMFYATAYMFMQLGAFVVISVIEKDNNHLDLKDYSGLSKSHPALAAMMAIFMFSLAGIPPFAGFPGKYLLFTAVIESGFTWLAIVGVVSSIISIYFYIGLVVYMYFRDREGDALTADVKSSNVSLVITTIAVFAMGIFPNSIINMAYKLF